MNLLEADDEVSCFGSLFHSTDKPDRKDHPIDAVVPAKNLLETSRELNQSYKMLGDSRRSAPSIHE
jgi:hypothetical protein